MYHILFSQSSIKKHFGCHTHVLDARRCIDLGAQWKMKMWIFLFKKANYKSLTKQKFSLSTRPCGTAEGICPWSQPCLRHYFLLLFHKFHPSFHFHSISTGKYLNFFLLKANFFWLSNYLIRTFEDGVISFLNMFRRPEITNLSTQGSFLDWLPPVIYG